MELAKIKFLAMLAALLLGVGLFVFCYRKVYSYFRFRKGHLKALGIYHEKRKKFVDPVTKAIREKVVSSTLGIRQERSNIVLTSYNPALSANDFSERLKPNIEHILGVRIEHVSSRKPRLPWRQREIVLHVESFAELLAMKDCPRNLEPGQYWLGKTATGEHLVLDLRKGDFSLGIFALAGAGKGNSIMAVADSFLESWIRTTGNHFYRLLILDAKGTDFHSLLRKYSGSKSLNPIFIEELREVTTILFLACIQLFWRLLRSFVLLFKISILR